VKGETTSPAAALCARSPGAGSVPCRLDLARFCLANGFSAEALGLINLMQAGDPALQSDRHLQTMRAPRSRTPNP
jgi:hypothetical protein